MKTVLVIRDGETKLHLPNATIRSNGTVWACNNKNPLIDAQAPKSKEIGKEKLAAMMRAGKSEEIPFECLAQYGENESGMLVIDAAEYREQQRAAMTPAQNERIEISNLYAQAEQLANSPSEDNVSGPIRLRAKADAMLAKWRETYTADARKEDASKLRAKADRERSLAVGALTYDADGWLSPDDQKQRHDEHIAKSEELDKQAAKLEA